MALTSAAALALTVGIPVVSQAASATLPTARSFTGVPAVGAIFGSGPGSPHSCTASVVRGSDDDRDAVVLTSAHCLIGSGRGVRFAPGYRDGVSPYGVWTVTAAYVDPHWLSGRDPQYDYVFLAVARQRRSGRPVGLGDAVTGYRLGGAANSGRRVRVVAYRAGIGDRPVTCTARSYRTGGFPAFDCHGYVGGTSGAPWLTGSGGSTVVRGVIGGLHHGGCVEFTSYSPRFDAATAATLRRALGGGPGDLLPRPGGDGC